jgi:hypothetical protein
VFQAGRGLAAMAAAIPLGLAAALLAAGLAAGGAWWWVSSGIERRIARGDLGGAEAAIEARAAERGADDPKVLYLRGRLAAARASAGRGSVRDAYRWWTRAVVAGSGDALGALEDEAEGWECDRRRLATHALVDTRSPRVLRTLRRIEEREPAPEDALGKVKHLIGADGQCGAGDVAREGIRAIEAAKR